jgi:hypothetical protein
MVSEGRGLTMHSEATPSPLASPDSDQHRIDADDSIDVPPASPSVEQKLEVQQELAKLFELVAEHVSQEVSGTCDSFFSFLFGCFSSIVLFSLVLNAHCSCGFFRFSPGLRGACKNESVCCPEIC